ncbi:glycosyltransferase [Clostridium algidicarnis]|uniref:glycosyltransferase n=1 Tax=Clostridium algidicarnis TaxID=37659 RepID=UPI001CF40A8C|nr:glycosyltransferase [Clostridium algidicarnis]MCB2287715.1 glycosyltransferase [Clostridium algidicarnis]
MKKILIILGSYFPKPSANGICVKQIVEEFKSRGVDVSILATQTKGLSEHEIIEDVNIFRVKSRWFYRALEFSEGYKQNNVKWIFQKLLLFINKFKNILFFPTWPLISPIYTYRYYKKASELHKQYKYDGILSVYTPIDSLIAGALIKRKYTDVKLMLYFLDTLSGGVVPKGFSRKWLEKRGYRWDEKLFNIADTIFVMKSHEHHYSKERYDKFRNKIKIVDIPLLRKLKNTYGKYEVNFNKEKINIVYTGTLLKHIKNPTYILNVFKNIKKNNQWNFHIFGGGDCDDLIDKYIKRGEGVSVIKYGHVDSKIAINAMLDSDILINIGSTVDTQIPSKIFEYMATGKPIISFYKYDTEPSMPYLNNYPLSLLIKEDWDKVDESIRLTVDFINKYNGKSINYSEIKDSYRNNTPELLVKYVVQLIDKQ